MRVSFKKDIEIFADTPSAGTEKSLFAKSVIPSSMPDPGGQAGSGGYPKVAALILWYDKAYVYEVWAALEVVTKSVDQFKMFMYWQDTSQTARSVETEGMEKYTTIPRIRFKLVKSHTSGAQKTVRMFSRLKVKDLLFMADKSDLVGTFGAAPLAFPVCFGGVVGTDGLALAATTYHFHWTVGCKAILFRRDEIVNP